MISFRHYRPLFGHISVHRAAPHRTAPHRKIMLDKMADILLQVSPYPVPKKR